MGTSAKDPSTSGRGRTQSEGWNLIFDLMKMTTPGLMAGSEKIHFFRGLYTKNSFFCRDSDGIDRA